MARPLSFLFILATTLLLNGCISTKPEAPVESASTMQIRDSFVATGKIGIRGKDISESARFSWNQSRTAYDLRLTDPFGRQVFHLEGSPGVAKLRLDGEEQTYLAESAEQLMFELLGWNVPVEHALYWVQGKPDPSTQFNQTSPGQFIQANWEVSTLDQLTLADGTTAPRKLKLKQDQLTLTLILSNWSFP